MFMPVVKVREVWMRVGNLFVAVVMAVRFTEWVSRLVDVLVVFVMHVQVVVPHRFVPMLMLVPFG